MGYFPSYLNDVNRTFQVKDVRRKVSIYKHERPCCIGIYKLEPKTGVVCLIQRESECCKWLVKLTNFIDPFAK